MSLFDETTIENFRKKYSSLHPLILHRSAERASSLMELFDLLENIPSNFPIVWDEKKRSWVKQLDITAQKQLKNIRK
jgi:hypothetical protein